MGYPVTGPTVVDYSNNRVGPGSYRVYQKRYKQKPPFNLDLPYYQVRRRVLSANGVKRNGDGTYSDFMGNAKANLGYSPWQTFCYAADSNTPEVVQAEQLARAKFSAAVSEQAQVLVNLAERAEVKKMIVDRLVTYGTAARQFLNGNKKSAWKTLGLKGPVGKPPKPLSRGAAKRRAKRASESPPPINPKAGAKSAAGGWLEWHFGWAPLMGDIHRGLEILTQPVPVLTAVGKGSAPFFWTYRSGNYTATHKVVCKATIRADVELHDRRLYQLEQLGLLNPLSVAWELVPFSFLVDWFGNVGSCLAQYSEFQGLKLTRQLTSWKFVVTSTVHYDEYYSPGKYTVLRWTTVSQAISSERKLGIPDVRLSFKMPKRLSWQRGLTAVSILTQFF